MWWCWVNAVLLFECAQAFAFFAIRWDGLPSRRFALGPRESPHDASFSNTAAAPLTITDQASPKKISYFIARPDRTISLGSTGLCIEATGKHNGDAVRMNYCTASPSQLWTVLPWGRRGQNQIQLDNSKKCLNVVDERNRSNGAGVELRECAQKVTELWRFESAPSSQESLRASDMRHVQTFLAVMVGLVSLSLGVWMSWGPRIACAACRSESNVPLSVEQAVFDDTCYPKDSVRSALLFGAGGSRSFPLSTFGAKVRTHVPAVMALSELQSVPTKVEDSESSTEVSNGDRSKEAADVQKVLQQLTPAEKVRLLSGRSMWFAGGVPRLGLEPMRISDGPHGMRGFSFRGDRGAILAPCEMALAATFDENLIAEVGTLLGEDCARRGGHVLLGPCLNIQRTPLFGRHFECFSEDAFLSSRAAVAYVLGVQKHVAACAKHFVCNDQENYRHTMDAVIDDRTLHEIYLAPFEAAVKEADVESIMCGYNQLNGSFCAENEKLLQKVLRDDWGFRGWVISDWFGNRSTVPALRAGLNVEMPGIEPRHYGGYLLDAFNRGEVPDELLDARCTPVLRTMLRHAENPMPGTSAEPSSDQAKTKRQNVLHRAAAASCVLLRNENSVLPLDLEAHRQIAVIGPCAAETVIQGGGSSRVRPRHCDSILDALRSSLPEGSVLHEPGCLAGELQYTTSEFEALKPMGGCDACGQPGGIASEIKTRVIDTALAVFAPLSNNEFLRRFAMPILRTLGLRQADAAEMAAKRAKDAEQAARSRDRQSDSKVPSTFSRWMAGLAILAGITLAGISLFSARGNSSPIVYVALGALSAILIGVGLISWQRPVRDLMEERRIVAAEEAARKADACILVLGSTGFVECEGMDRSDMLLPGRQNELAARVAAAAKGPVVVVLNVGSPKELPWLPNVSSVLLAHYGGEEMSAAVVETLLGVSCPSGRLPMTWPTSLEEAPAILQDPRTMRLDHSISDLPALPAPGQTLYSDRLHVGYRAFDGKGSFSPLFAFGHGLSYTNFAYGSLNVEQLSPCIDSDGPRVLVQVKIQNDGAVSGAEVVQLYTEAAPTEREPRPGPRALRAFARTADLAPGEEQCVLMELKARDLGASYNPESGSWLTPLTGQTIRIEVGASSADIRRVDTTVLE